jgi:hypothetical protein
MTAMTPLSHRILVLSVSSERPYQRLCSSLEDAERQLAAAMKEAAAPAVGRLYVTTETVVKEVTK